MIVKVNRPAQSLIMVILADL